MFGVVGLENISGNNFFEVLRSLVSAYLPGGGKVAEILLDYAVLFLLLGIAVGVSQCFFGYRLRRYWTAILMAISCGCGGGVLAAEFGLPIAALVGITVLAAAISGLFGYFLWIVGCFLRPFAIVSIAVFSVFVINQLQTLGLIIGLAAGLIAGILVAAFYKVGLRLYTAVFGGLLFGECVWELTGLSPWYPALVIGGVFALVGLGIQIFTGRKPKEENVFSGEGISEGEMAAEGIDNLQGSGEFFGQGQAVQGSGEFLAQGQAAKRSAVDGTMQPQGMGEVAATAEPDTAVPEGFAMGGQAFVAQPGQTGQSMNKTATASSPVVDKNSADADFVAGEKTSTTVGICPSCGTPYSARAKFCMQCGCKLQV